MKKTMTFGTAALLILSMLATACGGSPASPDPSAQETQKQVMLSHYFSGSLAGGIDTMVAGLNASVKGYRVNAVPIEHESYKLMIREELKSQDPADLYSYWAGARTQSIIADLQPIDDLWRTHDLDSVFPQFITDVACTYDGQKYLIPITQHFIGLVYNKKIFMDLGLSEPRTWEEFIATCETLKNAGITPIALGARDQWPAQFWFDYIQVRTQPLSFRAGLMEGKAPYTSPQVADTFERWKGLIDKGYFNRDANDIPWDTGAGEMVYRSEAAMTLMGTWIIGYYQNKADPWVLGEDFGIIPFPVIDPDIPLCAMGPVDGIVIPARAPNRDEAAQVVAFFADKETQKMMSQGSGAFAPSLAVEDSFYTPAQQQLLREIRKSPVWTFAYDLSTRPEAADIGLDTFADFLEFPDDYAFLLEETQRKMESVFVQ